MYSLGPQPPKTDKTHFGEESCALWTLWQGGDPSAASNTTTSEETTNCAFRPSSETCSFALSRLACPQLPLGLQDELGWTVPPSARGERGSSLEPPPHSVLPGQQDPQ